MRNKDKLLRLKCLLYFFKYIIFVIYYDYEVVDRLVRIVIIELFVGDIFLCIIINN